MTFGGKEVPGNDLANNLGRSPGSVSYKLANFASLDPSLDRKGAYNTSKLDREVWNDIFGNLEEKVVGSKLNMAALKDKKDEIDFHREVEGKTKDVVVKQRINQNFFRRMILSTYNNNCCITGISLSDLLIASHIVPWSVDEKNRLNPRNGLCLNALHDRAFDCGLITINEDFQVLLSPQLCVSNDIYEKHKILTQYENKKIMLPNRFLPNQEFLEYHRKHIFRI